MIEIKDTVLKKIMSDNPDASEGIAQYLLKNYSSWEIAMALGEKIIAESKQPVVAAQPPRITITPEEFLTHFKIRGYKPDGTRENRGNKTESSEALTSLYSELRSRIKQVEPDSVGTLFMESKTEQ